MSGGANRGAWEVGVMWGLAHYGNPTDFYWDVISGISAGAINTAGTAGWAPEEVLEMTEYLSDAWNGLFSEDIWQLRPLPGALNVFNEESLLDDSAALETIREIMSVKTDFARRVTASAVDIGSGEFV